MTITLSRGPPGFVYYQEPFMPLITPAVTAAIKEEPGSSWDSSARRWKIPVEEWPRVLEARVALGHADIIYPGKPPVETDRQLRPYQQVLVDKVVSAGIGLASFGVGLGKTLAAIAAAEVTLHREPTVLAVVPPKAVDVWRDEIRKWNPVMFDRELDQILVVNYNQLDKINPLEPIKMFIFDEIHHFKNPKSERTKRVYALRTKFPNASAIGLTATPTADNPLDLWMPFELLRPGGFGSYWRFRQRYFWLQERTVGFGEDEKSFTEVAGLHPLYGPNLKRRIDALSVRATRQEWAQYLPPLTTRKTLGLSGASATEHVRDLLGESGSALIGVIHRERAYQLGQDLGLPVVTGEMPLKDRVDYLNQIARSGGHAVVTMGSVGESISLTAFTHAIVMEIPDYPIVVTQFLGRVHRSDGTTRGVLVDYVVANSDVGKLAAVEAKMFENQQIVDGDSLETGLTTPEADVSDTLRGMMEQ